MALINCPECNKEVSDKAIACPNCGLPIFNQIPSKQTNNSNILDCPDLTRNLHIGKQIVNWGGDSAFQGEYQNSENVVEVIPSGKITVILHTHGIRIATHSYRPILDIHNSQIISFKQTTKYELVSMDKSVIGRAVFGGLILGPLGAVVGGMSGIGTKQKMEDKSYLVINYWDISSKTAQTLLISGKKFSIESFVNRNKKEDKLNHVHDRKADNGGGCLSIIIIPIGIAISYYLL